MYLNMGVTHQIGPNLNQFNCHERLLLVCVNKWILIGLARKELNFYIIYQPAHSMKSAHAESKTACMMWLGREREMLLRLAWLCVRACIWFMCSNIKIICRERRTGFKTSLTSLGWLRGSSCWDKITRLIVRCGFWCAVILLPTDQEMHFTYHVLKAACCRSWRKPAADKSNWRIQKCARSQLCRPHHHAGA